MFTFGFFLLIWQQLRCRLWIYPFLHKSIICLHRSGYVFCSNPNVWHTYLFVNFFILSLCLNCDVTCSFILLFGGKSFVYMIPVRPTIQFPMYDTQIIFIPWCSNWDVACGFMVFCNRISLFDIVQSMPFDKFPMINSHVCCFISSDVAIFLYPRASFVCIVRTISSIQFPVCNTNIWISSFDLAAPVVMWVANLTFFH